MNRVVVGIGSNIDPHRHIDLAVKELSRDHHLIRCSSRKVTAPIGYTEQPDFVNGAALIDTVLDTAAFTVYLKTLEQKLGRVRSENKFGPRTIDLDIVVWNGVVVDEDYYTRDFLRNAVKEVEGEDVGGSLLNS